MRRGRFTLIRQHMAGDEGRLGLVVRIPLTSDHLIIDDARDYLPLFQIDRVFGPYAIPDCACTRRW